MGPPAHSPFLAALLPFLSQAHMGDTAGRRVSRNRWNFSCSDSLCQFVQQRNEVDYFSPFPFAILLLDHCSELATWACLWTPVTKSPWAAQWHDQESTHPPESEVHSTKSSETCGFAFNSCVCVQKLDFFFIVGTKAQPHTQTRLGQFFRAFSLF